MNNVNCLLYSKCIMPIPPITSGLYEVLPITTYNLLYGIDNIQYTLYIFHYIFYCISDT